MAARKRIDKTALSKRRTGEHGPRFEHWIIDHQVYFLTARCRDRFPAFESDEAKDVFVDRMAYHANANQIELWVATVVDNHYHLIAYAKEGRAFQRFVQRLHGSAAKLVNDLLPERREQFWRDARGKEYFDGCLRDRQQLTLAWRYTLIQSERHGVAKDWRDYRWTHEYGDQKEKVAWAVENGALMEGVPYARYQRKKSR